ncbi:sulfotransferase [Candidatus Woesearchaeota archaeon]|nr:sulfotransferase [Candidatus Woesearchaeota archaeon]
MMLFQRITQKHQKLIIVCNARTGSNHLINLLNSHPNIKTFGEIFNLEKPRRVLKNPLKLLKETINKRYPSKFKVVSIKILYSQLTLEDFVLDNNMKEFPFFYRRYQLARELLSKTNKNKVNKRMQKVLNYLEKNKEIKIIHLKRRNLLETYLSLKLAMIKDEWVYRENSNDLKIKVDFEDCLKNFEKIKYYEKKYDDLFKNHKRIDIFYEDLIERQEITLKKIQRFLELPENNLKSKLKKQGKKPSESILNYKLLKTKFNGTPWEEFFE